MARSKHSTSVDDAFDLFLDTICNAFGGLVFIALLVIVLLQVTGNAAGIDVSDQQPEQMQQNLEILQSEIDTLEALHATLLLQLQALESRIDPDMLAKIKGLQQRQQAALDQLAQLRVAQEDLEAKIAEMKKKIEEGTSAPDMGQTIARLKQQLEELERENRRNVSSSSPTATTKQQIPVFISGNRLLLLFDYSATEATQMISEDVSQSIVDGRPAFLPKPGAGIPIADTPQFRARLQGILLNFKPETHYLGLAVWPDSFESLQVVRSKIADMGFGYYLIIQAEGQPVTTGGRAEVMGEK